MENRSKQVLIIIIAAAVGVISIIPAVYDNSAFGYIPILIYVLVLLISWICMQITKKSIRISSDFTGSRCRRGKSVTIDLNVSNTGIIMCPKAEASIFISDLFGGNDTRTETLITLAPKSDNSIGFDMDMPHIGVFDIGIDRMILNDFFGIFSNKVNIEGRFPVFVLPNIFPIENIVNSEMIKDEAPKERSTAVVGGTDYMGTREYEPGDSIKNIHWKLSAKSLGFMTKVFESSREMDFTVVLDFSSPKRDSRETAMDIYDAIVETGLSLIEEIAKTHTSYYLLYPDKNKQLKRMTPKGRDDDLMLIKDFSVLKEDPGPDEWDAYTILEDDNRMSTKTSNIIVVTARITEDLIQEIVKIKRQGRSPELYLVIPAGLTSRERDDIRDRMAMLDEANVYYNFVTAGAQ